MLIKPSFWMNIHVYVQYMHICIDTYITTVPNLAFLPASFWMSIHSHMYSSKLLYEHTFIHVQTYIHIYIHTKPQSGTPLSCHKAFG